MQNVDYATDKQIQFLNQRGWHGDASSLTKEEASHIIQKYLADDARNAAEAVRAEKEAQNSTPNEAFPSGQPKPQPKQEVAEQKSFVPVVEKNISDKVINAIHDLETNQGLILPKNYAVTNALKSAYLKLSEGNLLNTDPVALADALLNMCIQGLNPAKNQCYFINYNNKVNLMRSYFGDRTVAINTGLVKDIDANIIYEGDEVNVTYIDSRMHVEHKTNWENFGGKIIGAYAYAILPDGTTRYDIMKLDRIQKSWQMSKNNTNNKLQNTFTDDACKRTVIRHLVKMIFNETSDANMVVKSYNDTTEKEYINDNLDDVSLEQESKGAKKEADIDLSADDLAQL